MEGWADIMSRINIYPEGVQIDWNGGGGGGGGGGVEFGVEMI